MFKWIARLALPAPTFQGFGKTTDSFQRLRATASCWSCTSHPCCSNHAIILENVFVAGVFIARYCGCQNDIYILPDECRVGMFVHRSHIHQTHTSMLHIFAMVICPVKFHASV